ncbi:carbon-nitrogen family hydrolase [Fontisphaera persica]|uniref:carbon-nitrogen family hydrolase n=1 Tax=Fontisphaera persica TaxID=2974023 RepID=UPI0024BF2A84|nr:carbon-nitrogen family hydrolase [Fontisphaera persica]WCJ60478.1 carbon-nitrogen family hydrolase [Fontisphaera persica]
MRVIGLQYDIVWENKAANFQKVRHLLGEAALGPDTLVVLPEMFATGFSMQVAQIAEPAGGPTEQFLAQLAREYQCTVVGGKVSPGNPPLGRNEAVIFDPQGQLAGRYAKQRTFNPGDEGKYYESGSQTVLMLTGSWRWSPFICYDLRFPELFRRAAKEGAELFVIIANWPLERIEHWQILLRARAIENQAYVVGVNRCGRSPKLVYGGQSLVISPRGEVLAQAGDGEAVLAADIERESLLEYRRDFPVLADLLISPPG